jgi:transposase InsO family protein
VLLATDYFTKWVEAIPLKKVTSENMIEFVKEHIIYRFGISQTITTDQGTQFTFSKFRDFAESMGIKLLNSSPYYAQANGQEEASNKIMIKIIQKKTDQKPKRLCCGDSRSYRPQIMRENKSSRTKIRAQNRGQPKALFLTVDFSKAAPLYKCRSSPFIGRRTDFLHSQNTLM